MVSSKIKNIVLQNLTTKFEEAKSILKNPDLAMRFNIDKMELPTVTYNLTGGVGGKARYSTNNIRLNRELIIQEDNFIEVSEKTLYHELAHLITDYLEKTLQFNNSDIAGNIIPNKPHGYQWKYIMELIGEEPSVTHNMKVKKRKSWKIKYECSCMEHIITKNRHHKIVYNRAMYKCKKCKTLLTIQDNAVLEKL